MNVIRYFESGRRAHWLAQIGKSDWSAGGLLYRLLESGAFFDALGEGSDVLLLVENDTLISYCTFAKKDDIQPTELSPWVGFVYTFPAYRGHRYVALLFEEADRARSNLDRARRYARERYDEERASHAESRERMRQRFNEEFDEFFGPFSDTGFQKHLVGAGLELWMALNALVRAGPFPDSVKEAFTEADRNKNAEFCVKNEQCSKKPSKGADEPQPIKITAKGKKE